MTTLYDLDVNELGEDGGAWFIQASPGVGEYYLRRAVVKFLQSCYGPDYDTDSGYLEQLEALATASVQYKSGWWATGHAGGFWVDDQEPPVKMSGWFIK